MTQLVGMVVNSVTFMFEESVAWGSGRRSGGELRLIAARISRHNTGADIIRSSTPPGSSQHRYSLQTLSLDKKSHRC